MSSDPDVDLTTHRVKSGKGQKINETKSFQKSNLYTFNDYTPKNNKLFIYPYNFIRATNNMGSFNDYRIEEFTKLDHDTEETVNFQLRGVPCMNFSGKVTPLNYKRCILK